MKIITILAMAALLACNKTNMHTEVNDAINKVPPGTGINYLALGDSYTIGEAVPATQSFPYQLAVELNRSSFSVAAPVIIAKTGWTTDELVNAIKERNISQKFDFVTLLIGVNNQYRGYDINIYRTEFKQLLNTALSYANGNKSRVFVLSTPDWGVTPFATGRNRQQIATEIDQYNAIAKEETLKAGVSYTDITDISRQAPADPALIATDGLHPSGKMYDLWVRRLAPIVAGKLK